MAHEKVSVLEFLRTAGLAVEVNVLREGVRVLAEALMALYVEERVGAQPYERGPGRRNRRNGRRLRPWRTRVGENVLALPKLRQGSYLPSFLEPRRRAEVALLAVVQEAHVPGVRTRTVEERLKAGGLDGLSRSQVSRICRAWDQEVEWWRGRPFRWQRSLPVAGRHLRAGAGGGACHGPGGGAGPGRAGDGGAGGAGAEGRPLRGWASWLAFLRRLVERGLQGVRLVASDAPVGLREASSRVFAGARCRRCRVHFPRHARSLVSTGCREEVAAALRSVVAQLPRGGPRPSSWR